MCPLDAAGAGRPVSYISPLFSTIVIFKECLPFWHVKNAFHFFDQ